MSGGKVALDLSKFKKVASDAKTSTLRHDDGHQLRVDHSKLTKPMLSALEKLPMADEGVQRFADGGEAMPNPSPNVSPEPAEPPAVGNGPETPVGAVEQPPEASPEAEEADEETESGATGSPSAAPAAATAATADAPTEEPSGASASAAAPPEHADSFSADPNKNMQLLLQHDSALFYDLQKGHIQPKTYHDLFEQKDTLGKVGTIFGLLLGGLSSGLTGKENPVAQMMRDQISQDLDAQKANVGNKMNLLSINRQLFQDQESVVNFTRMQENRMVLDHLAKEVQKYPPGSPMRLKAEQALMTVGQSINTENYSLAGQIAAKQALMKSVQMSGSGGDEAAYQNSQAAMRRSGNPALAKLADVNDERHIPGIPGQASIPIPPKTRDEVQAMNVLDNKAADLLTFAQAHKGTLSPSQRAAGAQKAEEMLNFYNRSIEGGVLTEGRLAWLDKQIGKNPTSVFQDLLGNNARLNEIKNSNSQRRNILLKGLGFPTSQQQQQGSPQPTPKPQPGNGEILRRDPRSGKIAVFNADRQFVRWQ